MNEFKASVIGLHVGNPTGWQLGYTRRENQLRLTQPGGRSRDARYSEMPDDNIPSQEIP